MSANRVRSAPAPGQAPMPAPTGDLGYLDDDPAFVRGRGEDRYRAFTTDDEGALHDSFVQNQRARFWDL